MQKIIPHLWFDTEAKEAANFYVSCFKDSKITHSSVLKDTPSGDCDILEFELSGYTFMAISAGPYFKKNPSISFMLNFDPSRDPQAREHLDELWSKLTQGGTILMPLQEYPFSKHYGWVQDRYGVSWQLILTNPDGEERPFIIPSLMFTGDVTGKAEEATNKYLALFGDSKRGTIAHYPIGMAPDKESTVMFTDFKIEGQWFAAMDSGRMHDFSFNEGISLLVQCDSQQEIDRLWSALSAHPESEQCGWLKDAYGVSWQITPTSMQQMMRDGTPEQVARVTKAFMPMKKLDMAVIEKAYRGE